MANVLLLISSYVFYGWWDWRFLGLIIFSSFADYFIGIAIAGTEVQSKRKRKRLLLISLCTNLGLLAVFKYFDFFSSSFEELMSVFGWQVDAVTLNVILPVGISFYTFQTLSYTIDIYRRTLEPTKDVVSFFTYVSFFPQLVAGPIERAASLLPQIESKREFSEQMYKEGTFQFAVGLFRKVVIADNLAPYVDTIYRNVDIHEPSTLLLATLLYAFQIYFDFSGYSDMAIGTAKFFGFRFNRNFNLPYFSKSLTEFWRKWHISLSSWLRDYLYISLGGNRKGQILTYRNLLITMLLGGLWHGSAWTFVIWGAIHGFFLAVEKFVFSRLNIKNFNWLGYFYTFFIVILAWAFFRAESLSDALLIVKSILSFQLSMPHLGNINTIAIAISMVMVGILFDLFLARQDYALEEYGGSLSQLQLGIWTSFIIVGVCLFYSTSENFIYFQF